MLPDLTHIFASYETLRAEADALFARIASMHPDCVSCHQGCSDCCHALFDLPLVEAMYINNKFGEAFQHGLIRSRILERASEVDRKLTRKKREFFHSQKKGESPEKIFEDVSGTRMRCPLLAEDSACLLYEHRPLTCRLYGVPLAIGDESHVCGLSSFEKGRDYPAVKLAKIQKRLEDLGNEIAAVTGSDYDLHDVYVPVSMALLTNYDEDYFGLGKEKS